MGLIEGYKIQEVRGDNDLVLEADANESFIVHDVLIHNPVSAFVSVWVEQLRAGYFKVSGSLGSHLSIAKGGNVGNAAAGLPSDSRRKTILGLLSAMGIFEGYPVPAGSKFTITGAKQAGAIQTVIYSRFDPGDVLPDQQNGEHSTEKIWLNYGSSGAVIATAGDHSFDTPSNPEEFDDFPYGDDAPANKETEILGILGSDFAPLENDGTNDIGTSYLKLIREQRVMFDEDLNGLPFYASGYNAALTVDLVGEGHSVIGSYSTTDPRMPFFFPEPLVFRSGEILTVKMTAVIAGTGANIAIADQEIAMITRTRKV
jgi:hypothetical protein